MKLIEAIQQLANFNRELTIYVREPWSASSEARVALEGSVDEAKIKTEALSYFLEVFIAQDFLEDWKKTQKAPSAEHCCVRLIEYAMNDA
jgi:hypothetical protein